MIENNTAPIDKSNLLSRICFGAASIQHKEILTETDVWYHPGLHIYQSNKFKGIPSFYPVYRYANFYSYSPLHLIINKGFIRLNPRTKEAVRRTDFSYCSTRELIDSDIVRIGGPMAYHNSLVSEQVLCEQMANAMTADIEDAERRTAGFTNVILCGGKDSLNLLLLPWQNRTIVASAHPNYPLVRNFIDKNRLDYPLIELHERTTDKSLEAEILANCCQINREHVRWTQQLAEITSQYEGKVVFWLGQIADAFLTPYWKRYRANSSLISRISREPSRENRCSRARKPLARAAEILGLSQHAFMQALWYRAAMLQGAHLSLIRAYTRGMALSAYHGPQVQAVVRSLDLHKAVQRDVRGEIGRILAGRDVIYPETNPGPPASKQRREECEFDKYVEIISRQGIKVEA